MHYLDGSKDIFNKQIIQKSVNMDASDTWSSIKGVFVRIRGTNPENWQTRELNKTKSFIEDYNKVKI